MGDGTPLSLIEADPAKQASRKTEPMGCHPPKARLFCFFFCCYKEIEVVVGQFRQF
jgi:hypothetical protein